MDNVIQFDFTRKQPINVGVLKESTRKLRAGLIAPAKEEVHTELAEDRTSEPIKKMEDINRISEYLLDNERYRDYMLFIVGINFGLRVGDLRMLRFQDLIMVAPSGEMMFKSRFAVFEQKTRNTRLRKKNRYITINRAVQEAVTLYLENTENVSLSDYLFRNESNNRKSDNEPINRKSIDRILKGIAEDLDLGMKVSTHTLRKTFGFHQMAMSGNSTRKLLLLSKMFGHSSVAITMDYIGVTNEEIAEAYKELNLGLVEHNYLDSVLDEEEGDGALTEAV